MKILVVKEKHGDYYMMPTLKNVSSIIRDRLNFGYYSNEDEGYAEELLKNQNIDDMLDFLSDRCSHEYEWASIENVKE